MDSGWTRLSLCLDTETRSLELVLGSPEEILLNLCLETRVLLGPNRGPERDLSPGLGPEGVRTSGVLLLRMILVRLRSLNGVSTGLAPVSMATGDDPSAPSDLPGALHLNRLRSLGLTEALGDTGLALSPGLWPGLGLRGPGFSLDPDFGLDSCLWTLETHWYLDEALLSMLTRVFLVGTGPSARSVSSASAQTLGRSLPFGLSEPARTQMNLDWSRARTDPWLSVFALFTVSAEAAGDALFITTCRFTADSIFTAPVNAEDAFPAGFEGQRSRFMAVFSVVVVTGVIVCMFPESNPGGFGGMADLAGIFSATVFCELGVTRTLCLQHF